MVAVAYRSETGSLVRATFDLNLQHRVSMIDMRFRLGLALVATRKFSFLIFGELDVFSWSIIVGADFVVALGVVSWSAPNAGTNTRQQVS